MPSLSFLLLFLSAACFQRSRAEQQYTVYLNSSNGATEKVSCWEGDQEVPCQSLENIWIKILELTAHAEVVSTPSTVADGTIQEQWSNSSNESIGEVCPTWMHHSNETGRCKCGVTHHEAIKCNSTLNETYILDCYRMTYDETQGVIAGRSFYGCLNQANQNDIYHLVPANRSQINEVMCSQFYRDGRLCGGCKHGYSPLAYSYQLHCKKCTDTESKYNWAKFVAMAFVPLTGFYIFVLVFKFNANSPRMQGYVFFAQVMACPANIRIMSSGWRFGKIVTYLTKFHSTLYGIWNLDYFRTLYPDTCLQLTTLQALSLDYIIAIYPLVLILITYILIKLHSRGCRVLEWIWKLIKKCLVKFKHVDNIRASMIDVFATFLLLMYCKILCVNFDLLAYTIPIDSNGKSVGRYLYYDASYEHFGKEHLPYGIMAIVAFTVVNFMPFLLLLLYPMRCFQKLLNYFRLSHLALHTFVDSFAGCYKDGTEKGTRDCRYFAALFFLIRIISYIAYQATLDASFYGWNGAIITTFTILLVVAQPYKQIYKKYNIVTVVIFGIMILAIITIMNVNTAFVKVHNRVSFYACIVAFLVTLPHFYAIAMVLVWVNEHWVFHKMLLPMNRMPRQKSLSESSLLLASEDKTRRLKKCSSAYMH